MAVSGVYDGNVIKIPAVFEKGQRVLVIPVSYKINKEKLEIINSLKGLIHSDISLNEIKEERLKKYEINA